MDHYTDTANYLVRLASFSEVTVPQQFTTIQLARAGLYYKKSNLHCYCCKKQSTLSNLQSILEAHTEICRVYLELELINKNESLLALRSITNHEELMLKHYSDEIKRLKIKYIGIDHYGPHNDVQVSNFNQKQNVFECILHYKERYWSYKWRLQTFTEWKFNNIVCSEALADAGFYCLNTEDRVQCFFCKLNLKDWKENDIPVQEHFQWNPTCFFMLGKLLNSVLKNKNIVLIMNDVFDRYISFNHNFYCNGYNEKQTVVYRQLAISGFYALNNIIKCFMCGLIIEYVYDNGVEHPLIEHAYFSPSCCYVLFLLGAKYVKSIVRSKKNSACIKIDGELMNLELRKEIQFHSRKKRVTFDMDIYRSADEIEHDELNLKEVTCIPEKYLCKICMVKEIDVLFIPCFHMACCIYCSEYLSECCFCRMQIQGKMCPYVN